MAAKSASSIGLLIPDTFTIRSKPDLSWPLCSYSFSEVRAADQEQRFEAAYRGLDPKLQETIKENRIVTPPDFKADVFGDFYRDIRSNSVVLEAAVRHDLKTRGIKAKNLKLSVEETDPEDFRVENNPASEYGISEQMAHQVIERSILAVAGLRALFVQMKICDALSGVTEKDLPVLQAKFGAAVNLVQAGSGEKQFERVAKLAGLEGPVFGRTKVDAQKLLKIRESDDCRAFRDWMTDTNSLSDKEITDRVRGLNAQIRHAINSTPGKTLRFLVNAGLSLVPHAIVSLGEGAVDTFILERLAPRDAVVAFLSDLYPSVFKKG